MQTVEEYLKKYEIDGKIWPAPGLQCKTAGGWSIYIRMIAPKYYGYYSPVFTDQSYSLDIDGNHNQFSRYDVVEIYENGLVAKNSVT
jgi:hypothetical protein